MTLQGLCASLDMVPTYLSPEAATASIEASWRPSKRVMGVRRRKGQETLEAKGKLPEEGSAMVRWDRDKNPRALGTSGASSAQSRL